MVDSGVYAGCTVDQMLSGKQFDRAVRRLTLVYEALMSLWFAKEDPFVVKVVFVLNIICPAQNVVLAKH